MLRIELKQMLLLKVKKQNEIVNNTEATTEEKEVASQQLQQVTDRTNNSIGLAQDTDQV